MYLALAGLGGSRTDFLGVDLCWTRKSRPAMIVSATDGGAGSVVYGGYGGNPAPVVVTKVRVR